MGDILEIDEVNIAMIANGHLVRVEYKEDGDDWRREKFFFDTIDEVLAFIETNLD